MLYLAEVQKQKGGLLSGSGKTELKLLACQRTDQNWNPVSEEVIAAEEASKLNDGALVLVELNPNRQVQRIQEAGRPLVNILQNFSRQLEKFKLKEDEIDQWKQSLTFQAQELNRREMDMEVRSEQLHNMEDELQQLEQQKQEVDTSRQEIERLQTEVERNRLELEGAWEHLRGEQRRLEERLADFQQGTVLDEEQSRVMSELLDRLSNRVAPTETVREHLHLAFELVEKQQATLTPHWQKLEEQKTAIAQQQEEVERLSQTFSDRQNALQQAQNSLVQQTAQLQINTADLSSKQEYARIIKEQLRNAEELYQQIHSLAATSGSVVLGQQANVEALEKMPLEELQKIVQDLQYKLEIDASFVHDQEQELKYKEEAIKELQNKLNQASDHDHINLELELTDEKDMYQMLNSSLVGQRRNMLQHQKFLKQHQAVLLRRQGHTVVDEEEGNKVNLEPILLQLETQRQECSQEVQKLEREIDQIRSGIELNQGMIDNQTHDLDEKRQELKAMEENLLSLRRTTAECCGRVNLYQEALQPIQDSLDGLRQKLQEIRESLEQFQETGDYQVQAIAQLRHTLQSLMSQPQLVVS
ncbi:MULTISPECIES: pilus motility taxis protein HmpF [unclassified Nostoc]|uniref:pilus motility taxis protein HmpF n=1 Tax=unclassified Nostoc TaxID=2593658 RepID=UPI002AD475DC|nr:MULTISPECIES: pilus motility taxis protein HmpF [unclassified Nostoc]MDZ8121271.1 pilus motility taxis protein HmpF [Nostoc sp. CmiVER01]MDZ8224201.1 pilus motility taxis protein HmpF [Nostoc sp. ChiVER01]